MLKLLTLRKLQTSECHRKAVLNIKVWCRFIIIFFLLVLHIVFSVAVTIQSISIVRPSRLSAVDFEAGITLLMEEKKGCLYG